ncbi:MAG: hypothetical protein J6A05_08045 [Oscillospiraceae bacterium]|nr:hypothetical protein [Oscillospiraceae bacterium]
MQIELPELFSFEYIKKHGYLEGTRTFHYDGHWNDIALDLTDDPNGVLFTGIIYKLYPNGNIYYYASHKDGVFSGPFVYFYDNGNPRSYECYDGNYSRKGNSYEWYENGQLKEMKIPQEKNAVVIKWHENGQLKDISIPLPNYIFRNLTFEWDENGKLL